MESLDDQGVFSGIVGNTDWLNTFGHPTGAEEGIIVSIYNLVCYRQNPAKESRLTYFPGCFQWMYYRVHHIRETWASPVHVARNVLHCRMSFIRHLWRHTDQRQIIGAILQTTSYSVAQILVARYITGIGTGIETSTVPMYQSELCEARKRGRLVSSEPLFVGVGIVIAYFFDYGLSFVGGKSAIHSRLIFTSC